MRELQELIAIAVSVGVGCRRRDETPASGRKTVSLDHNMTIGMEVNLDCI